MTTRTVSTRFEMIIDQWQRAGAQASATVRKVADDTVKFGEVTDRTMNQAGRAWQSAGAKMTVGVTAPMVLFAKQAAQAGMTAQETANRVVLAYGEQEQALRRWSAGSVDSMGLARHEAEGAASTLKLMFGEMGLGAEAAYDMSTGMVQLASDVGSLRDVDPTDMLVKMRAAAIGEYEPMRQIGIVLTDMAVREEAVRLKLAERTAEVSTAALVQARYSLILQQTTQDQGDFARTADDATNSTRRARAAYSEAMAELGDNMLPLIANGADLLSALAQGMAQLPEPAQNVLLGFGGIAAVAGPLLIVLGSVAKNLDAIRAVAPGAARGLGLVSIGAASAVASYSILDALFGSGNEKIYNSGDAMRAAFTKTAGALDDTTRAAMAAHLETIGVTDAFASAGITVDDLYRAARGGAEGIGDLARALYESGEITSRQFTLLGGFSKAVEYGAEKGEDLNAVLGETGRAGDEAAAGIGEVNAELDELFEKTFAAETAQDAFNLQLLEFADRVRAAQIGGDGLATSMSNMTLQGLENRSTIRDLAAGIIDYSNSAGASADVTAAMRQQLVFVLEQLGFNRTEVDRYIGVLLQIPAGAHTQITADASQARAEIASVINAMSDMQKAKTASLLDQAHGRAPVNPDDWRPGSLALPAPRYVPPPGLAGALAGQGPNARAARDSGASRARQAADDAKRAAEQAAAEQKRQQEELTRFMQDHYRRRQDAIDIQYEEGRLSLDAYIKALEERHHRLVLMYGYDSTEAQAVRDLVRDVRAEVEADARKVREEAAEAAEEARKVAEDRLKRLNDLLDDERDLRAQVERSAEQHRRRMADINAKFAGDQANAIEERRQQLMSSMRLDQQFTVTWGNSMAATIANGLTQNSAIGESSTLLGQLRDRGLSSAVVQMLGLDEGPQALGQLRAFASATDAEIAQLNAVMVERQRQVDERVTAEKAQTYSKLSQTLLGITERFAAEVETATEEFLAEQRELNAELAQVGLDGGRTWADAIALGIRSQIPAIRQAAEEAMALMNSIGAGATGGVNPMTGKLGNQNPIGGPITMKAVSNAVQAVGGLDLNQQFVVNVYDANGSLVTDDRLRVAVEEVQDGTAWTRAVVGSRRSG